MHCKWRVISLTIIFLFATLLLCLTFKHVGDIMFKYISLSLLLSFGASAYSIQENLDLDILNDLNYQDVRHTIICLIEVSNSYEQALAIIDEFENMCIKHSHMIRQDRYLFISKAQMQSSYICPVSRNSSKSRSTYGDPDIGIWRCSFTP